MRLFTSDISQTLPNVDKTDYRSLNKVHFQDLNKTCIVIDDDPTGNQTVHNIPLLTQWDVKTLSNEFKKKTPVFFLLTNSRSLTANKTAIIYQEIVKNISKASKTTHRSYSIISRSDSTLRGHFQLEIDTIKQAEKYQEAIVVFVPVLFEGGRVTVNDTHFIKDSQTLIPVNETPFAQDHSFAYSKANLKEWILEKTKGEVDPVKINSFSIEDIRKLNIESICDRIIALPQDTYCIINALNYYDLDKITNALLLAEKSGKKIIYRTSSSFVPSYIGIATKDLLNAKNLISNDHKNGGLIVVGSYVPKTSEQLNYLLDYLEEDNLIEANVNELLSINAEHYIEKLIIEINHKLTLGKDVVLYTSRELVKGKDINANINIGTTISNALVSIVKGIQTTPKYLLTKGGITSHDIATKGLSMKRSKVIGQILPGVPVWEMDIETRFPKLPYIVFPGNVGDKKSLYNITQKLS